MLDDWKPSSADEQTARPPLAPGIIDATSLIRAEDKRIEAYIHMRIKKWVVVADLQTMPAHAKQLCGSRNIIDLKLNQKHASGALTLALDELHSNLSTYNGLVSSIDAHLYSLCRSHPKS